MAAYSVFITGGTGYVGSRLVPLLLKKGMTVRALVRKGSEQKLPPGCTAVLGDALDQATFASQVAPSHTFIQLVGVAHPSPSKGAQFKTIDLVSVQASVSAAVAAGIQHFIYVSVAQPAPVMKEYIAVRAEGEALLKASGLNATILQPWYILGPGHRWPVLLVPIYWMLERVPKTRDSAQRLGLVTISQMLTTLVTATETPAKGIRIIQAPQIKRGIEFRS